MTFAPAVFRPKHVPGLAIAAGLVAIFFLVQALIAGGMMRVFALVLAAIFAAIAIWYYMSARRASVIVRGESFTIQDGRSETTYERSDIESIDLRSLKGQLKMRDGKHVWLPLEGSQLVEISLLLAPGQRLS